MNYPGYKGILIRQQMAVNLLEAYLDGREPGLVLNNVTLGDTDFRLLVAYIEFLEKRAGMSRLTKEIGPK